MATLAVLALSVPSVGAADLITVSGKKPQMTKIKLPPKKSGTILLAAVGDVLMHNTLQRDAAGKPEGFSSQFSRIAAALSHADVTFANLEVPIAANLINTGKEVAVPKSRYDGRVFTGYPQFNAHPSLAMALKKAGVDVVQTANNHSLDRRWRGIDRSIEALKAAKMPFTGTRHTKDLTAPWYTITRVSKGGQNYKIAWLACTYGTNEIVDHYGQVLFCFKQQKEVLATIAALAKRRDIHAVMFTPHWGREYRHAPTPRQKKLGRLALEAGATAVIGTHPHVLQPFENYTSADGRKGFIAYSLGNFISGQGSLARRSSVVLYLVLGRAKGAATGRGMSKKLAVKGYSYLPTHVVRTTDGFFVQPAGTSKNSLASIAHIQKILPKEGMLMPR